MAVHQQSKKKGDGHPSPFLKSARTLQVPFESSDGIEHVTVDIAETITIRTSKELIVVDVPADIREKIGSMIAVFSAKEPTAGHEPDLPLNCRSTAQWLMRGDKSLKAESGQERGLFIELDEAKKAYGYPLGVEWSTGHRREDVTPFHEGVILGPVGSDELVFEKPGYSLPYQFSLLSAIEARNVNMAKNKHNLRSFYGL